MVRPYNASALAKGTGLMEVVPEEKEKGKNLRNSVNSLQVIMKTRGHGQKKGAKTKSTSKYIFDSNARHQRKAGATTGGGERLLNLNVKDPLKNI